MNIFVAVALVDCTPGNVMLDDTGPVSCMVLAADELIPDVPILA